MRTQKQEGFSGNRSLWAQRAREKRRNRFSGMALIEAMIIVQMGKQNGMWSSLFLRRNRNWVGDVSSLRSVGYHIGRVYQVITHRWLTEGKTKLENGKRQVTPSSSWPCPRKLGSEGHAQSQALGGRFSVTTSVRRGTKATTQPSFSWVSSRGLGSTRTQVTGLICTEGVLQSLAQKTKYFLSIGSNSLALQTKGAGSRERPCQLSPESSLA